MPQAILTGGHDFQSCRKTSIFDWASAPAVLGSDFFSKLSSSAAQSCRKASIFDWASAPDVYAADFFSKLFSRSAQQIPPRG